MKVKKPKRMKVGICECHTNDSGTLICDSCIAQEVNAGMERMESYHNAFKQEAMLTVEEAYQELLNAFIETKMRHQTSEVSLEEIRLLKNQANVIVAAQQDKIRRVEDE